MGEGARFWNGGLLMSIDPNVQALQDQPKWGKYLYDAFRAVEKRIANLASQTNSSLIAPEGSPPPQVNAISVNASGGIAHVQVTDNNQIYRGINYYVDYSTDPGFSAPVTHHLGPSRDARIPVGNQPLYYRAYSGYPTSSPSAPVYHGGVSPIPVTAAGSTPPPVPSGQGSGTGFPGQISGHGPVAWRGAATPRRG